MSGGGARVWGRDLALGARFAVTGGREGWVRIVLTAVGVGLGVALLLLTTAIPSALSSRHVREISRNDFTYGSHRVDKGDGTEIIARAETTYRNQDIRGRLLQPEGPKAPLPPGVRAFPAPDEMVVSPALDRLLKSADGKLLRERLPYRITGTIGDSGLIGPAELAFYAGGHGLESELSPGTVERIGGFTDPDPQPEKTDPVLLLLILIVFVVLLLPVAVFIAAAVRFGGERRDRRLAALRLVGADGPMTRRIAAGEALAGSLLGLVFGAGFFLGGRQLANLITLYEISIFPSDLDPTPALAALVAVAVPASAVAVTLLTLRRVIIEPLGVVRTAGSSRRRLWWRLLLPLAGLGLLYPMVGKGRNHGEFNQWMVIGGTVLLLVGVTALLPWLVEAVVTRLGAGPVSWQLAVRRLQLSGGTAARMVNGIAVAVAGAVALQMLFAGVEGDYTKPTGQDLSRAQMEVRLPARDPIASADRTLTAAKSVRHTTPLSSGSLGERPKNPRKSLELTVGSCRALREVASLTSCRDGDVFAIHGAPSDEATGPLAKPGRTLYIDPSYDEAAGKALAWRLPGSLKQAGPRKDPTGYARGGLLVTPGAVPAKAAPTLVGSVYIRLDERVPDARDLVRNAAARIDPLADAYVYTSTDRSRRFESIRTGLFIGATCVLLLIGASLLVSQLEQLRERKKLLSALIAFGTRRRTLSLSVLWQTAVPIALGLALASAMGMLLGAVLMKMAGATVSVDWRSVLAMTGVGAGIVLLVTTLSLPPLLRLMRPDGLRTE
ncbi:ABC transporter permease [Streptomyces sp. NPDC002004]